MSYRANLAVLMGVLAATIAIYLQDGRVGIIQDTANMGWERAK